MVAAWQSAVTPVGLRFSPVDEALALRTLRRELDELPETHHPLGL